MFFNPVPILNQRTDFKIRGRLRALDKEGATVSIPVKDISKDDDEIIGFYRYEYQKTEDGKGKISREFILISNDIKEMYKKAIQTSPELVKKKQDDSNTKDKKETSDK